MKYIDNNLFDKLGYITELNRIILHPLGLSMVLDNEEIKIQDHREVKEGVVYSELDECKKGFCEVLEDEYNSRKLYRFNKYGWYIQPLE